MKLSVSDSKFALFNSTGNLLQGKKQFDSDIFIETAKKLDKTDCALYAHLESGKITLGCRYLVEIIGGREERVSVIAEYKNPLSIDKDTISTFFEEAKQYIENLKERGYRVIGIWESGDLPTNFDHEVEKEVIEYCAGKILANEKVSIKSPSMLSGIVILTGVLESLIGHVEIPISGAVSRYPFDVDLSLSESPGKPDIVIKEGEVGDIKHREYYRSLFNEITTNPIITSGITDRYTLAKKVKSEYFIRDRFNIIQNFRTDPEKLLLLYLDNLTLFQKIASICLQENPPKPKISEDSSLLFIETLAKSSEGNVSLKIHIPGFQKTKPEIIGILYRDLKSDDNRKKVQKILIEYHLFAKSVVADMVEKVLFERNRNCLRNLSNLSFNNSHENRILFDEIIKEDLKHLSIEAAFESMQFILNEDQISPKDALKITLRMLYERFVGTRYLSKLSHNEIKNLNRWIGVRVTKERLSLRSIFKYGLFGIVTILVICLVLSILLIIGVDIPGSDIICGILPTIPAVEDQNASLSQNTYQGENRSILNQSEVNSENQNVKDQEIVNPSIKKTIPPTMGGE